MWWMELEQPSFNSKKIRRKTDDIPVILRCWNNAMNLLPHPTFMYYAQQNLICLRQWSQTLLLSLVQLITVRKKGWFSIYWLLLLKTNVTMTLFTHSLLWGHHLTNEVKYDMSHVISWNKWFFLDKNINILMFMGCKDGST